MSNLCFAIPTLFGLEGICADEVRRLELPQGIGPNALPGILTRVIDVDQLAALIAELREEAAQGKGEEDGTGLVSCYQD